MKNKAGFIFTVWVMFLNPLFLSGQQAPIPTDKRPQTPHETSHDSYLPNAYGNKKTSPAYKYKSAATKSILTSTIFTTQVNVNANGQNVIGDAANEPNIDVSPIDGNIMAIGWRQFDNVGSDFRQGGWGYTTNAGQTWTFPGVLEPGIFHTDPVLDFDSAGNFYYNSLDFNNFCKVFKSTNGGSTWDSGTNAEGGDKQWMVIDRTAGVGSGNIYSVWNVSFSTCLPGFFTRSTDANLSYESCTTVDGEPFWGNMAIDNNGVLYITGSSGVGGGPMVVKSLNALIPASTIVWEPAVLVFLDGDLGWQPMVNPAGLLGQANIDIDRSNGPANGNVYVLASVTRFSNGDPGDVMFARSTDGGSTWEPPVRVNDDLAPDNTQWLATMSVAPNGRIDAIWLDTRDNPGTQLSALYYSYSIDQGTTWSANEILSGIFDPYLGYPNQNKMGDYFDMISDNSGAHLAWANTLNGEEDVYYSHIVPPVVTQANELSGNAIISVFPNPTHGVFFVTNAPRQSYIEIFTVAGKKIFSSEVLQAKTRLDLSAHPAGIYFLKLVNPGGSTVVRKLVRE